MTTESRIHEAIKNAEDALWGAVVNIFPEAKTGDLSPEMDNKLTKIMEEAIREWVENNVV